MPRRVRRGADLRGLFGPAWAALQARHAEMPRVSFEPMPDAVPARGFGAVAIPGRHQDGTSYAELTILVAAGWLYSAEDRAFLILAHEATHVLDYARYGEVRGHGEVFAALARELGLAAEKLTDGPRSGDYEAALTDSARTEYAEAIKSLGVAWEKLGAVHWVV